MAPKNSKKRTLQIPLTKIIAGTIKKPIDNIKKYISRTKNLQEGQEAQAAPSAQAKNAEQESQDLQKKQTTQHTLKPTQSTPQPAQPKIQQKVTQPQEKQTTKQETQAKQPAPQPAQPKIQQKVTQPQEKQTTRQETQETQTATSAQAQNAEQESQTLQKKQTTQAEQEKPNSIQEKPKPNLKINQSIQQSAINHVNGWISELQHCTQTPAISQAEINKATTAIHNLTQAKNKGIVNVQYIRQQNNFITKIIYSIKTFQQNQTIIENLIQQTQNLLSFQNISQESIKQTKQTIAKLNKIKSADNIEKQRIEETKEIVNNLIQNITEEENKKLYIKQCKKQLQNCQQYTKISPNRKKEIKAAISKLQQETSENAIQAEEINYIQRLIKYADYEEKIGLEYANKISNQTKKMLHKLQKCAAYRNISRDTMDLLQPAIESLTQKMQENYYLSIITQAASKDYFNNFARNSSKEYINHSTEREERLSYAKEKEYESSNLSKALEQVDNLMAYFQTIVNKAEQEEKEKNGTKIDALIQEMQELLKYKHISQESINAIHSTIQEFQAAKGFDDTSKQSIQNKQHIAGHLIGKIQNEEKAYLTLQQFSNTLKNFLRSKNISQTKINEIHSTLKQIDSTLAKKHAIRQVYNNQKEYIENLINATAQEEKFNTLATAENNTISTKDLQKSTIAKSNTNRENILQAIQIRQQLQDIFKNQSPLAEQKEHLYNALAQIQNAIDSNKITTQKLAYFKNIANQFTAHNTPKANQPPQNITVQLQKLQQILIKLQSLQPQKLKTTQIMKAQKQATANATYNLITKLEQEAAKATHTTKTIDDEIKDLELSTKELEQDYEELQRQSTIKNIAKNTAYMQPRQTQINQEDLKILLNIQKQCEEILIQPENTKLMQALETLEIIQKAQRAIKNNSYKSQELCQKAKSQYAKLTQELQAKQPTTTQATHKTNPATQITNPAAQITRTTENAHTGRAKIENSQTTHKQRTSNDSDRAQEKNATHTTNPESFKKTAIQYRLASQRQSMNEAAKQYKKCLEKYADGLTMEEKKLVNQMYYRTSKLIIAPNITPSNIEKATDDYNKFTKIFAKARAIILSQTNEKRASKQKMHKQEIRKQPIHREHYTSQPESDRETHRQKTSSQSESERETSKQKMHKQEIRKQPIHREHYTSQPESDRETHRQKTSSQSESEMETNKQKMHKQEIRKHPIHKKHYTSQPESGRETHRQKTSIQSERGRKIRKRAELRRTEHMQITQRDRSPHNLELRRAERGQVTQKEHIKKHNKKTQETQEKPTTSVAHTSSTKLQHNYKNRN